MFVYSLQFLCSWLEQSATAALRGNHRSSTYDGLRNQRVLTSARTDPRHVHCVAAILWFCNSRATAVVQSIVSLKLFRFVTSHHHHTSDVIRVFNFLTFTLSERCSSGLA